jgi:two-component system sensor histidine kinase HydH
LVLATLGLVGVLLITTLTTFRRLKQASEQVVRGEASGLSRTLQSEFRGLSQDPTQETLEDLIEPRGVPGLRTLALYRADGTPLEEAGTGKLPAPEQFPESDLLLEVSGCVAKVVTPLEPAHGHHFSSLHHRSRSSQSGFLAFEYHSELAEEMARSGSQSLWVGGLLALVFLFCAGFLLRLLEERVALAERQARQERLASLGEMSAVLAHEIRNPLTSLKGHSQLLQETAPEGRIRMKADRIIAEVGRLEALVNDLLDFVRTGKVEQVELDPVAVLQEAVELVGEGEEIRLVVDQAPTRWALDRTRMRQVLVNLLQNACQASPEGNPVEVSMAEEKDWLVVRVMDQGPGVSEEEVERIFEPFVTRRSQGTGLGLAVARRLTELHGGSLTVSSGPEGGACFLARIPRSVFQEGL